MAHKVMIHIANEEPIVADLDELPAVTDTLVVARNPTTKDGKDLRYLYPNVTTVIWPVARLSFIEILPSGEEEEVVGFVRE